MHVCISLCRPLYLSSQTVLTFDSMSISSTLVTGSPLLVTHLHLDQLSLFLSDRQHKSIQLRKGKDENIIVYLQQLTHPW